MQGHRSRVADPRTERHTEDSPDRIHGLHRAAHRTFLKTTRSVPSWLDAPDCPALERLRVDWLRRRPTSVTGSRTASGVQAHRSSGLRTRRQASLQEMSEGAGQAHDASSLRTGPSPCPVGLQNPRRGFDSRRRLNPGNPRRCPRGAVRPSVVPGSVGNELGLVTVPWGVKWEHVGQVLGREHLARATELEVEVGDRELPEFPSSAICWPLTTLSPTFTWSSRARCAGRTRRGGAEIRRPQVPARVVDPEPLFIARRRTGGVSGRRRPPSPPPTGRPCSCPTLVCRTLVWPLCGQWIWSFAP